MIGHVSKIRVVLLTGDRFNGDNKNKLKFK